MKRSHKIVPYKFIKTGMGHAKYIELIPKIYSIVSLHKDGVSMLLLRKRTGAQRISIMLALKVLEDLGLIYVVQVGKLLLVFHVGQDVTEVGKV